MKNILVTGGAGFIGSNLVERLLDQGNRAIILDNFNDYYSPLLKEKNICQIHGFMKRRNIPEDSLKLYRADIRDMPVLKEIFKENSIDVAIHLAAMAGVRPSIASPGLYYDVNVTGTLNLLEVCKENNVRRFIFASSSSVYGNNEKLPFSEQDAVDNPISPYAASKKAGELLCHTYHHLYEISIVCLRFFTVYGPRQRPDLAIHKFARLMLEGKPVPLYGDGKTARDYTYIDDTIDGVIRSIEFLTEGKCVYEIINLGESKAITLSEMIETLESVLGRKAQLCRKLPQPGDVDITYADITKARSILGYSPKKEFREGIEDFIRWLKV